eukprot:UN16145
MTKQVTYAKRNKTYEEIRQTSVRPIPQSSTKLEKPRGIDGRVRRHR